jgi:predicted GNAT family N-acyltransferase
MIEEILNNKFSDYLTGLDIYEDGKSIKLARIVIKDEFRGSGVGSDIMSDLINYADNNKKIITLTPSSDFGGNKNRLIQFYKRFGFKPNKGVHKSYEYMDVMIRWPKINEGSPTKTLIKDLLRESLINFR